ncbi:MAG: efflux RND transporter permease subunit, partial [Candidatus Sumerlaeota bacterium]|nr:efflux RND transporter permease subunit [Candidatus Sumerlaeota bacterium]
ILTLLGLAAGVGILVDNSIVVVENVYRYHQRRRPPREAAWLGSREVVRAIVVSTATNLVVFIPLLYIDEMIALVMKEMALSLVFPMLASLLVAITLVPMLAAKVMEAGKWLRSKAHEDAGPLLHSLAYVTTNPPQREGHLKKVRRILSRCSRLMSALGRLNPYRKPDAPPRNLLKEFVLYCAKGSLRHPIRLFFVILIIFLTTLIASGIKIVIQRHSRSQKTYSITLYGKPPLSSTLKDTDQFFLQKERQIAQEMKKSDVFKSFSSRFTKDGGEIALEISDKYQSLYMDEFILAYKNFRSGDKNSGFRFWPFPSASLAAKPEGISYYDYGGSHGMPESVLITGENIDAMQRGAEMVKEFLQKDANIGNVEISTPLGTPEVQFIPDLELFLVMKADVSTLQSFFQAREERGIRTSLTLTDTPRRVERQVTVRVVTEEEKRARGEKKPRQTLRELKRTMIPLQGGGIVPLERLGSFIITHNTPTIEKKNRQRNINVGFSFQQSFYRQGLEKKRQETLRDIQKRLNTVKLPGGISAQLSGSLEEAETGRLTLRKLLLLAVLAIFLVMAFFFDSLISPIVILATLPLACIGGIWGIIIFNTTLNEIAMLGTILLAGLAVNNGILLIEFTRQMENWHGYRRSRALLAAISYRLRPILMTSLTTILGLLPILFSTEAEMEARSLVSVLVGGMSVSMLLTLVVIPTFYNVLSIGIERLKILKARLLRHQFLTIAKPADSAKALATAGKEMHISIKNISKMYPVFKWKKLLRIIPSRTYPIGHRPPEGVNALKHVTLEIEPGMFGLLGPNGAGKTTLMKILTGIIEPTYGVVEMLGCNLRFHRQDIRSYISYLPQNFGVYESLNIEQYLNFFAPYYGLHDLTKRRRRIDEVIEMVGLSDAREKPMKRFSGGMRQRAGVAQFMLNPRPLIIVDEPTAGLDPVERVKFRLFLSELAQTRIVLLSTHIVDDITSSCKCVAVLNRGEVLYQGDVQGIQAQAQNLIWDIILPADQPPPIPRRQILFRRHTSRLRQSVSDGRTGFLSWSAEGATRNVLCHYVSENPLPGSTPVQPSFEDAYVALLLKHDASSANTSPLPNLHDSAFVATSVADAT